MPKPIWVTLLFWASLVLLFLLLSTSVGLVATGYQLDWQNLSLTRTGLIYLAGSPKTVTVTMNREAVADRLPVRLPTVFPGEYKVEISKEGYVTWEKILTLAPGEARSETDILLFLAKPEVAVVTDPELIEQVKKNNEPSSLISGQELRFNNRLVTRISGTIVTAALNDARSHIFFQVGREIRVIEVDGSNEIVLYTLQKEDNSQLIILDDAKELALLDTGEVKRLRIR